MRPKYQRIFGIVIDSVGIGFAPDSEEFGDKGANTLRSVTTFYKGKLNIPNLTQMGLSNIVSEYPLNGVPVQENPKGYFGKMYEISSGKDSMDGHFEMMGLPVVEPLGHFPNGFDEALIDKIERFSGRQVIREANKPYSGTDVIRDFGERQLETGELIIYTSGDSVLQIAANTNVIPLEELYKICEFARDETIDNYRIGRIIARPYIGTNKDNFERTSDRHDYAIPPMSKTDLDYLKESGVPVFGIGKINDIFSEQGINDGVHTTSNVDGMNQVIKKAKSDFKGFCFANLVDFDAKYGHRRDPEGFGHELETFDTQLTELITELNDDDLLIITADHGNDPCFTGTDHTREFVPLLVYAKNMNDSGSLGIRSPFADFGATVCENFGVAGTGIGRSFLSRLK